MKNRLLPAGPQPVEKIMLAVLVAQLLFTSIGAQTSHSRKKEDFDIKEFHTDTIDISYTAAMLQLANIGGIAVVDARADTAWIGFKQKKVVDPVLGALNNATRNQTEQRINKRPTFVAMGGGGLQAAASRYLLQSVVFPPDKSLPVVLMVIKKLWLSDELNLEDPSTARRPFTGAVNRDVWTSGIDMKAEFYLKKGTDYYPLYRYDSTISLALTISENGPQFVERSLELSVQKLLQMDGRIAGVTARKKFSLEEINRHNEDAFDLPVLKDPVLRPGVYLSFEEFKNNQPSIASFELVRDKLTDVLYTRQANGTSCVARNAWGYCNGKNAFIRSADNFFLLQRSANAFYIFGAKNIRRVETGNTGAASYYPGNNGLSAPVYYTSSRTAIQLEPFQLDWSTGKLY